MGIAEFEGIFEKILRRRFSMFVGEKWNLRNFSDTIGIIHLRLS